MATEKPLADYSILLKDSRSTIDKLSSDSERFVPIETRQDTSTFTTEALTDIKPRTIVEIGALSGGSALWFADHAHMFELNCHIYSLDVDISKIHSTARQREGITFIEGDCEKVDEAFPPSMIQELPHPWLIVEDAHVNVTGVLEHFYIHMTSGDYVVVEDAHPAANAVGSEEAGPSGSIRETLGLEKMKCIRSFLAAHPGDLLIDTYYVDMFGYNMTFNANGFIRKM